MSLSDYTDVTTLRDELAPNADDPSQDDRLARAVTDASRAVDAFCQVEPGTFAARYLIRYFDGVIKSDDWWRNWQSLSANQAWWLNLSNSQFLLTAQGTVRGVNTGLPVPPLIAVSTLKTDEDGDGVFETVWTAGTDYLLYPLNAEVKDEIRPNPNSGKTFPIGLNRVEVNGTWGHLEDNDIPTAIRRVTLLLATNYYRRPTQSAATASQGIGGAAVKFGYLDPDVAALLWSVTATYRQSYTFA